MVTNITNLGINVCIRNIRCDSLLVSNKKKGQNSDKQNLPHLNIDPDYWPFSLLCCLL